MTETKQFGKRSISLVETKTKTKNTPTTDYVSDIKSGVNYVSDIKPGVEIPVYPDEVPIRFVDTGEWGEPGDAFFTTHNKCYTWDNCDGYHLHVVCPDGAFWDIDSRANNCTKPEDKTHRCWIRHGDIRAGEKITVDKQGLTCAAGAGSIQTSKYHGHLANGVLKKC